MNVSSIFQFFDNLIWFDHLNIQDLREDYENDPDYSSSKNIIVRYEIYDSRIDDSVSLEEPQIIPFENYLKSVFSAEVDSISKSIEKENANIITPTDNILFLNGCLAKSDILLMRSENIRSDYSNVLVETLRRFAIQLHQRFDKELNLKIESYASTSGKSMSKILLELQQKNEIDSSRMSPIRDKAKLKFNLNRNQITILFLLLAHNEGLTATPAEIAKFLEENCLYWKNRTKEYLPVSDVTSLISDFKSFEKKTDAPTRWIKHFFQNAKLKF